MIDNSCLIKPFVDEFFFFCLLWYVWNNHSVVRVFTIGKHMYKSIGERSLISIPFSSCFQTLLEYHIWNPCLISSWTTFWTATNPLAEVYLFHNQHKLNNDKVEMYLSIFQWMLISDYVISTSQDMYMYGGLILTLNTYFTKYSTGARFPYWPS